MDDFQQCLKSMSQETYYSDNLIDVISYGSVSVLSREHLYSLDNKHFRTIITYCFRFKFFTKTFIAHSYSYAFYYFFIQETYNVCGINIYH